MRQNKFTTRLWALWFPILLTVAMVLSALASVQAQSGQTVAQGSWTKVLYETKGSWKIVQNGATLQLQLNADFLTTNAPDLNIVFSPYEASALTSSNILKDAVRGGELTGKGKTSWGKLKGPITLNLPTNLDLSRYKSIAIHCIAYSKIWSVSKL